MKCLLVIAALALALVASADAKTPNDALTASQARIAAYAGAQGYFGDLFDSKIRLGKGRRLSDQAFVYPGRIGRTDGYVNCTFRIYVRATRMAYRFQARSLRCA